jgi:ABC-type sugar transport system ATPase subunit
MGHITLNDVRKHYDGHDEAAVKGATLEIAEDEFFVILGPSGCGKSTLLRLIAGLEEATGGEIWIDGRLVNYEPPARRNVAMVFQNYALYPQMSVERNIRFPLKMAKLPRAEQEAATQQVLRSLDLERLASRNVSQLSGGERQRVAVGRAIVRRPSALLMDEPLSNLDALLRAQTRAELLQLHREVGGAIVYVTHDQVEAMSMGDRIGVMCAGELVQVDRPEVVYGTPATRFVAQFIGSPPMNLLDGRLLEEDGGLRFHTAGWTYDLATLGRRGAAARQAAGGEATLGVRPESIELTAPERAEDAWEIRLIEYLGAERIALLARDDDVLRVRLPMHTHHVEGERVGVELHPGDVHLFDARGRNVFASPGALASVAS